MRGFGLIPLVFILLVFSLLAITLVPIIFTESRLDLEQYRHSRAFYISEAGRRYGLKHISAFNDWSEDMGMPIARPFAGGAFLLNTEEESADQVKLSSTGVITLEGKTYSKTISMVAARVTGEEVFNYALFFGGSASPELKIKDSTIYGDIFVNTDTEINDDSVIEQGIVYYSPGRTVEGGGEFSAVELTSVPSWPAFDNQSYLQQINIYDNAWAGGSGTWTLSSGTYTLAGETIKKERVYIRGNARIDGFGVIAATNGVEVYDNAVISPTPGGSIVLAAKDSVKITENATLLPGTVIYSRDNSALIHDANVEVYGTLIMSRTKVDIYYGARVSQESVVYIPPDCRGKDLAVFELENGSTFNGSIIVDAAADKKVRLDHSNLRGLTYVPYSITALNDMDIGGSIFVNKFSGDDIYDSVISGGISKTPYTLPSGFSGGGLSATGVEVRGWEEVY